MCIHLDFSQTEQDPVGHFVVRCFLWLIYFYCRKEDRIFI